MSITNCSILPTFLSISSCTTWLIYAPSCLQKLASAAHWFKHTWMKNMPVIWVYKDLQFPHRVIWGLRSYLSLAWNTMKSVFSANDWVHHYTQFSCSIPVGKLWPVACSVF
jgi:hypothetical protein